jgi:hypothetical protein
MYVVQKVAINIFKKMFCVQLQDNVFPICWVTTYETIVSCCKRSRYGNSLVLVLCFQAIFQLSMTAMKEVSCMR